MITYIRPHTGIREAIAAGKAITRHWLGAGPQVRAFEREFCEFMGLEAGNITTTASASDALCLAMELLHLGQGDEVIVPSIHYVGAANAVLRRGAKPVFCDVSGLALMPTLAHVRAAISDRTRAISLIYYGLPPADIEEIVDLGYPVVCDCAVGLGFRPAGVMGVWSFDAMKAIATPNGGALWCASADDAEKARVLCRQGMSIPHGYESSGSRWWEFEVDLPGRLSEMNDVAAAIGRVQLRRLEHDLDRRLAIAWEYNERLERHVSVGPVNPNFAYIQTDRRDALARYLRENGVYTTFRYYPLHLAYSTGQQLPGAAYAANRTLLLPNHAGLSRRGVRKVIDLVIRFHERGVS